jgi:hypothetical protein
MPMTVCDERVRYRDRRPTFAGGDVSHELNCLKQEMTLDATTGVDFNATTPAVRDGFDCSGSGIGERRVA